MVTLSWVKLVVTAGKVFVPSRGMAMNPVAHPMGGGEGRSKSGQIPQSKTGVLAKGGKTRNPNKSSSSLILRKRK